MGAQFQHSGSPWHNTSMSNDTTTQRIATRLHDVQKIYPLGRTDVCALKGVSITIREGDFASIAGPSGSGKSTLLNLIGCIDVPTDGFVEVIGRNTAELSDRAITRPTAPSDRFHLPVVQLNAGPQRV